MNLNFIIIILVFILFFISKYNHESFTDVEFSADMAIRAVSVLDLKKDRIGIDKSDDFIGIQNIYGDTLEPCASPNDKGDGFYDADGNCPYGQRYKKDTIPPRLCMKFRDNTNTGNFAIKTGYNKFNNWSEEFTSENKNNCVPMGAFSYFKSQQNKNTVPATYKELKCSAIPEGIFSTLFYDEWNKGVKEKYKDDDQNIHGLKHVFVNCLNNTSIPEYKSNLKKNFCKFLNSGVHNLKNNETIKELFDEHCDEEDN